jgi:hypothetical protein
VGSGPKSALDVLLVTCYQPLLTAEAGLTQVLCSSHENTRLQASTSPALIDDAAELTSQSTHPVYMSFGRGVHPFQNFYLHRKNANIEKMGTCIDSSNGIRTCYFTARRQDTPWLETRRVAFTPMQVTKFNSYLTENTPSLQPVNVAQGKRRSFNFKACAIYKMYLKGEAKFGSRVAHI